VDGDIVLESSRQISLKAGGSFIVIRAGGVDIVGPNKPEWWGECGDTGGDAVSGNTTYLAVPFYH
ncbi:hypothetical protein ACK1QP_004478, partial [Salmonella enterica]